MKDVAAEPLAATPPVAPASAAPEPDVRDGAAASAASPAAPAAAPPAPAAASPVQNSGTAAAAAPATAATADPAGVTSVFGTPEEEIARLLRSDNLNYYAVLKVDPKNMASMKKNYFKLSRLVHPDKCKHPDAAQAQAVVTQAYATLNTPMKKKMYDAYTTNVDTTKPDGMSYAEWESRRVEIPKWLERILRIPGGGVCLLLCLIPLVLILFIVVFVTWILCLPVRCFCRVCCGVKPEDEEADAPAAAADGGGGGPARRGDDMV